jgi:glycosyltransferase involved in cell wall biosynthesis
VNESLPSVTVLIAARPGLAEVKAVAAGRALDYPRRKLEIIVARGQQPSIQRNAGIKAAAGELIYFLDDDSVPPPEALRRAVSHFTGPEVQMAGGPNLCPPDAPVLERVFALVLGSRLAFFSSRARYAPVGHIRQTSEKELILCNLVARRDGLLSLGGFNEALYPNEENALMDELQKRGGRLIYDPELFVYRRPRRNLKAFARMLLTYGRGRAEQFRLHPTPGSVLNFAPPLFCLYLLGTLLVLVVKPAVAALLMWPLVLYALLLLAQTAWLVRKPAAGGFNQTTRSNSGGAASRITRALTAAPLIILTHILYGAGFWRGLFTRLKPAPGQPSRAVMLETIKHMDSD